MISANKENNKVSAECKSCGVEKDSKSATSAGTERKKYFGADVVAMAGAQLFKLLLGHR